MQSYGCKRGSIPFSLEASEEDYELAIRGDLLARTGWKFEYIAELTQTQILYALHWYRKVENDRVQLLHNMLGTKWTRDQILAVNKKDKKNVDEVMVPLALAIKPEMVEFLTNLFNNAATVGGKEYRPEEGEEFGDLMEWSKEDFIALHERRYEDIGKGKPKEKGNGQ